MKAKLIMLMSCWLLLLGCKHGEKEVIVVPTNYKGYIIIIYNQIGKSKRAYYKGSRLYRVPSNGILKTDFPNNYGYIDIPQFYYGSIASNNLIPFFANPKNSEAEAVFASGGSMGKAYINNDQYIEFQAFYIGNQKEIAKAYEDVEKLDITKL